MFKDRSILNMAIAQTLAWASMLYIFPALLLRWEQSLGWSKAELTAGVTLALLLSGIASPLAGRLIDIGRGPELMTGSTILGGLGVLYLSTVTEPWQFYAACAVVGTALAGCLYEPCFALVTRSRGADAKRAIILITLVAGFASAISFTLAYTLAEARDWRFALTCFAGIAIFGAAPLMWFGARALEAAAVEREPLLADRTSSDQRYLRNPAFWFLALGFSMIALLHGTALNHLLPMLDERGVSQEVAVIAASFIGPMQVAGRLAMMAAERHISNHGVSLTAFGAIGLSAFMLMGAGLSPVFLVAFVALFGGAYGTVSIIRPVIARDVLGERNFGAKSGALALVFLIGSAAAPYLGSLVWVVGGYDLVLYCLVLLAVIGCALYAMAHRLSQRRTGGAPRNPTSA